MRGTDFRKAKGSKSEIRGDHTGSPETQSGEPHRDRITGTGGTHVRLATDLLGVTACGFSRYRRKVFSKPSCSLTITGRNEMSVLGQIKIKWPKILSPELGLVYLCIRSRAERSSQALWLNSMAVTQDRLKIRPGAPEGLLLRLACW